MIKINDLKKHKNVYDKLKKKPLRPTTLCVMFDYCSPGIWCRGADEVLKTFSDKLQKRLQQWVCNLENLYMFTWDKKELTEEETIAYMERKRELNREGRQIAKEVNKQFSGSVSYFDEFTCIKEYLYK